MAAFQIPRTPHTTNKTIRFPDDVIADVEAAIAGKPLILNYNREIRLTQAKVKVFGKGFFLIISYDKERGQPHVCLFCSQPVRVRMIPVGTGPVGDGE